MTLRETDGMDQGVMFISVMDDSMETPNSKIQYVITLDCGGDA